MGFFTTITLSHDAESSIAAHPDRLMEIITDAITNHKCTRNGNRSYGEGIGMFCHAITVQRSRHADNPTMYVHMDACLTDMSAYSEDALDMLKSNPEHFNRHLEYIEANLKRLKAIRKEHQETMYHKSPDGMEKFRVELRKYRDSIRHLPEGNVKVKLVKKIRDTLGFGLKESIDFLESL